jgi:hypothetical protein
MVDRPRSAAASLYPNLPHDDGRVADWTTQQQAAWAGVAMTAKEELAALKREVEELKAKLAPPKSTFVPISDAEHQDRVHQMREGRMSMATPPSVARYFADGVTAADCADLRQQSHHPTGRPGAIPDNQQPASSRPSAGDGSGWGHSTPLGPPPGVAQADRLMDAQDARDRAELIEREAKLQAMQTMAEQIETMKKQTEALAKLAERKL